MISLCRTLLGFVDPDDRCRDVPRRRPCGVALSGASGLGCVAAEVPCPPAHVVESAAVRARTPISTPLPSPRPPRFEEDKRGRERPVERIDDGTRGLSYLYGRGGRGRLELCTESLGFESCCDGRMGAEEERAEQEIRRRIEEANRRSPGEQWVARRQARPARRRAEKKELPPPLTWLREDGGGNGARRRSFLKAVRKDGRLLLKEVQIERPEVLRASRQGGRLRLELVKPEPEEVEDEEVDVAEVKEAAAEVEEAAAEEALGVKGGGAVAGEAVMVAEEAEEKAPKQQEEEEELRWRLSGAKALERRMEAGGGGGGFRSGRCQELAREGLPSSPFWGSRFVTTA